MKTIRSEQIIQHIDSFPVLPLTVTRLIEAAGDPGCSIKDIVEILHSDQSLSLTVLKIANSALFGRPQKAASIKMAVVILGFDEVQRIALTKALINSFSKLAKRHRPFINGFWQHAFACGITARAIAPKLSINPDIALIGGLLHDIGKLIMLDTFADDYALDRWMTTFSTAESRQEELRMFSFSHDQVGGRLLKKWLFPENLVTAVSCHHCPEEAAQGSGFAYIIQMADLLAFYCCNPEALAAEDIVTAIHGLLPGIRGQWRSLGVPLPDAAITGWFQWLVQNHEQGRTLKESFLAASP
jgi:putative nucleotidyltransferase with HDIG domain